MKIEILDEILEEHARLERALAKVDSACMEISASEHTWSVKETLVHITTWEQAILADYVRLARGETIHEFGSDTEINFINESIRTHGKTMPLS